MFPSNSEPARTYHLPAICQKVMIFIFPPPDGRICFEQHVCDYILRTPFTYKHCKLNGQTFGGTLEARCTMAGQRIRIWRTKTSNQNSTSTPQLCSWR